MNEPTRGRRKSFVGTVVSTKMDKTAVVSVERRFPHPLYHKIVRSTKRYKAHDPQNGAVLGDVVRIVETRPLSKEKRWRIAETLVRGNVAEVAPREIGVPEEALYQPDRPEQSAAPQTVAEAATEVANPPESEVLQAAADDMDPADYSEAAAEQTETPKDAAEQTETPKDAAEQTETPKDAAEEPTETAEDTEEER